MYSDEAAVVQDSRVNSAFFGGATVSFEVLVAISLWSQFATPLSIFVNTETHNFALIASCTAN
jgi:hypothetical protein